MSVPDIRSPDRVYRPDIDGIRAIAILSVVLYHAGVPRIPGGFAGVDIFFVISGYLIGGHLFSELLTDRFSYLQFYRRRAKRILPAFYVMLAFTILAALLLLSPFEAWKFGKSAFAAVLSASNIYFWKSSGYFETKSKFDPLLMTWSLGVEEQFYAVIPVLMVLLVRIRRNLLLPAILALSVLSFLLAWYGVGRYPQAVFYLLPTRAWELGVGVTLAVAELSRRLALRFGPLTQLVSLTGFVLMLAPMAMLKVESSIPSVTALSSVMGAALIIATPTCWINRRLLSLPPLVFIGRISYSWYLWHWPIFSFLHIIAGGKLPPGAVALAIAGSLGMAIASYYCIEQPFRRSTTAPVPLLSRYAIVSILSLAPCAVIWWSHGLPQRNPKLFQEEIASRTFLSDPCLDANNKDTPNLSSVCFDASDPRSTVALWGDSHAAALAAGVRSSMSAQQYSLAQFTKNSCPPLMGAAMYSPVAGIDDTSYCFQFNHKVLSLLRADQNIKIVVLAAFWAAPFNQEQNYWLISEFAPNHERPNPEMERNLFKRSLAESIQSLQSAGKEVIVMGDVPEFKFDPLWRIRTNQIPARHSIALWMGIQDSDNPGFDMPRDSPAATIATSAIQDTVSAFSKANLIDLEHNLCNAAGQCKYFVTGQLLYIDENHLSPDGARYALRDFHLPSPSTLNK